MKNILYITIALLLLLGLYGSLQAQQEQEHTLYSHGMGVNPAYAGSRGVLSGNFILRKQWVSLEGSPTTGTFNFHSPILNGRHGLGMALVHDRLGVTRQTFLTGSYAYRIPMGSGTLALGLQGGFTHYANVFSTLTTTDVDPVNPGLDQSAWLPRAGTGIYFHTNRFYIGASTPNFIAGKYFRYKENMAQALASIQRVHYYATAGLVVPLGREVEFKPSVLMKYVNNSPIEFDLNANFLFKNKVWLGAGYRTGDALLFQFEYITGSGLRLGYAYDWTLTQLGNVNTGSHELLLGFDLGLTKSKIITPRYF